MTVICYDFDGTLIQGDSTKHFLRDNTSDFFGFVVKYYLCQVHNYLYYILSGQDWRIKRKRLRQIRNIYHGKNHISSSRLFQNVFSQFTEDLEAGHMVVVVSAGIKEIIELYTPNSTIIIANSFVDDDFRNINSQGKVEAIKALLPNDAEILRCYGNSTGDIPMLKLAAKAFMVSRDGEIKEFQNV